MTGLGRKIGKEISSFPSIFMVLKKEETFPQLFYFSLYMFIHLLLPRPRSLFFFDPEVFEVTHS